MLPGRFQRLHTSADGAVWLITDEGIARLEDGAWHIHLADFDGDLVGIDDSDRAWVVNEDTTTIATWDGSSWVVYGADDGWLPVGLEDDWYRGIGRMQSDGTGRLWLATSQDVRMLDGERWTVFTPAAMGLGEVGQQELWATFTVETAERTGTVWVGECDWCGPGPFGGQGVRWFDGETWHQPHPSLAAGCATTIKEDNEGRVWMGVEENLWRYDPASGEWTKLKPPTPPVDAMRFGFADAIALDSSGDPWPAMVLCGGASCYGSIVLYRVRDGAWMQIGEPLEYGGGLPPPYLASDAAGTRWLLWAGSLHRVTEEGISEPVPGLGLGHQLVVDAAGRSWLVARHQGQDMLWIRDAETGQKQ